MLILIHYGELALKGKNRPLFEKRLVANIENACSGSVTRYKGRLSLENPEKIDALKNTFGISWFAEALIAEKTLDSIKELVLYEVRKRKDKARTFGVFVKRADKGFPYTSVQVAREIGSEITKNCDLNVDLSNPNITVFIEIAEVVFVHFDKVHGLGGLPVGISGRVLCLLSGGIDSPVSAYLMMKRGCDVDFIHLHNLRSNEDVLKTKIRDIVECLNKYQRGSRIFVVPYKPFNLAFLEKGHFDGNELVLFRRFIVKIGGEIAMKYRYNALVTGDSLGQVASQTLENISVINKVISLPLLMPLISLDKQEIIDLAREIGTYDYSIIGYSDCCSILTRRPKTKARSGLIQQIENRIDIGTVAKITLEETDVYNVAL